MKRHTFRRPVLLLTIAVLFLLSSGNTSLAHIAGQNNVIYLPIVKGQPQNLKLGVHISIWEWDETIFDQIEAAGSTEAEVIRIPISWFLLQENGPDTYVDWYVDILKQLVEAAHQQNLEILFMMADPPAWAVDTTQPGCEEGRNHWCPPVNALDYAMAVSAVLDLFDTPTYEDTVTSFEVWNEPNYRGDTQEEALTAAEYVEILSTTYQHVKPVHPGVKIVGGALAGTNANYLTEMYQAGVKNNFDLLSIHPYSVGNTPPPEDCSDLDWSYLCGVELIRSTMVGAPWMDDKPIWFTEFGWSSYNGPQGVGESNQKVYLEHALALIFAKGWSFVETAIWYNLTDCTDRPSDQCISDPNNYHAYYGLFDKNLNPKPVASSFFVPANGNLLETVTVPGTAETGVTIPISTTGMYSFTILGGVYSPWSEDNFPNDQWRSVLYFYQNRPVEWELQPWGFQPGNPDFSIGNWEITGETQEQAELRAMGETISFSLQAGDQLIVVPVDVQGIYADNRGNVDLRMVSP